MSLLNACVFFLWYLPVLVFVFVILLTMPLAIAVGFFFPDIAVSYCSACLAFIERKEGEIARAQKRLSRKEPPDVTR